MTDPRDLPDGQASAFSRLRANGWQEFNFDGELLYMRKDVTTAPRFRSYKYIYITPKGKIEEWRR